MSPLTVGVVVVTWNAAELTLRCLDSLRAQRTEGLDVRLVVVDNGSTDGTAERIASLGDVRLVALPTNTGFAGGVNAGIAAADGDVVVLLNNDAVARPGFLQALVEPFRSVVDAPGHQSPDQPQLGATTGRVLLSGRFAPVRSGPDGTWPADTLVGHDGSRWARVDPEDAVGVELVNSTGNEVTRSGNGRDRDWLTRADSPPAAAEVFGFNGGCAALSRAALRDVGGFEEALFLYYEDTELSWRLRRHGWTVRHVPEAVTEHDHAASSGASSAFFLDHNERNRLLVAVLHAPGPVVMRAVARSVVRVALGPDRRRRLRVLGAVARRLTWALRRRRAIDRAATVPRAVPAALLVPDGAPRAGTS